MMITRLSQAVLTGCALVVLVSCASESPATSAVPSAIASPATSAVPSAIASPATSAVPSAIASPASGAVASAIASPASGAAEPRVIELELTSDLQIDEAGQRLTDIPVTPGETIHFVISNTAGFDHDFYIGTDEQLASGQVEALAGVPTWSSSDPQAFDWTVPEDPTNLKFGCTLRGHYPSMQGTFTVTE